MLDLCFAFEPNLWLFPDRRPRPAGAWATPVRLEVRAVRLLLLRALLVGALLLRPGLGALSPALSAGLVPSPETLAVPKQMILYAARAAGLVPLGILGSIAEYGDLDAYRATAERSRRFGFEGAACIHPSNVPVLNEVFTPAPEEAERARRIVAAYAEAERAGSGAISIDGKMIDVPVVERAQKLLARLDAIRARDAAASS